MHSVLGPQGEGSQGSGFSTHLKFWQMNPAWHSWSLSHSLLQPVMVSGIGMKPAKHRQIGLPRLLAMHRVFGPQGEG